MAKSAAGSLASRKKQAKRPKNHQKRLQSKRSTASKLVPENLKEKVLGRVNGFVVTALQEKKYQPVFGSFTPRKTVTFADEIVQTSSSPPEPTGISHEAITRIIGEKKVMSPDNSPAGQQEIKRRRTSEKSLVVDDSDARKPTSNSRNRSIVHSTPISASRETASESDESSPEHKVYPRTPANLDRSTQSVDDDEDGDSETGERNMVDKVSLALRFDDDGSDDEDKKIDISGPLQEQLENDREEASSISKEDVTDPQKETSSSEPAPLEQQNLDASKNTSKTLQRSSDVWVDREDQPELVLSLAEDSGQTEFVRPVLNVSLSEKIASNRKPERKSLVESTNLVVNSVVSAISLNISFDRKNASTQRQIEDQADSVESSVEPVNAFRQRRSQLNLSNEEPMEVSVLQIKSRESSARSVTISEEEQTPEDQSGPDEKVVNEESSSVSGECSTTNNSGDHASGVKSPVKESLIGGHSPERTPELEAVHISTEVSKTEENSATDNETNSNHTNIGNPTSPLREPITGSTIFEIHIEPRAIKANKGLTQDDKTGRISAEQEVPEVSGDSSENDRKRMLSPAHKHSKSSAEESLSLSAEAERSVHSMPETRNTIVEIGEGNSNDRSVPVLETVNTEAEPLVEITRPDEFFGENNIIGIASERREIGEFTDATENLGNGTELAPDHSNGETENANETTKPALVKENQETDLKSSMENGDESGPTMAKVQGIDESPKDTLSAEESVITPEEKETLSTEKLSPRKTRGSMKPAPPSPVTPKRSSRVRKTPATIASVRQLSKPDVDGVATLTPSTKTRRTLSKTPAATTSAAAQVQKATAEPKTPSRAAKTAPAPKSTSKASATPAPATPKSVSRVKSAVKESVTPSSAKATALKTSVKTPTVKATRKTAAKK